MTSKQQAWLTTFSSVAMVALWAFFVIIPLAIMISVAVKSPAELASNPFGWPQHFEWGSFGKAWTEAHLARGIRNSLILTAASLAAIVFFSASAAYPIARRTRWSPVFYFFLAGIMIPFQLAMLPLYKLMKSFHLINTYHGVIFIYTAVSLPMAIFLYAGFIKGINSELEDAAMVDGAGPFRLFWTIIFPLLKPVTSTIIIMNSGIIMSMTRLIFDLAKSRRSFQHIQAEWLIMDFTDILSPDPPVCTAHAGSSRPVPLSMWLSVCLVTNFTAGYVKKHILQRWLQIFN